MIKDPKGKVKGLLMSVAWTLAMITVFYIANIKNQNKQSEQKQVSVEVSKDEVSSDKKKDSTSSNCCKTRI